MGDVSPSRLIPRLGASPHSAEVSYNERRLRRWMLGLLWGLASASGADLLSPPVTQGGATPLGVARSIDDSAGDAVTGPRPSSPGSGRDGADGSRRPRLPRGIPAVNR